MTRHELEQRLLRACSTPELFEREMRIVEKLPIEEREAMLEQIAADQVVGAVQAAEWLRNVDQSFRDAMHRLGAKAMDGKMFRQFQKALGKVPPT